LVRSIRIAPVVAGKRRAAAQLLRASLVLTPDTVYGLVEFRCAKLCLDSLIIRSRNPEALEEAEDGRRQSAARAAPTFRLTLDETFVTCRRCTFEAEVMLMPPRYDGFGPLRPSLFEQCSWVCSEGQGLVICGMRPSGQHPVPECEEFIDEEAFATQGLLALRQFAGDLTPFDQQVSGRRADAVLVPNGLRFCVVRDCEAHNIRLHALLLRWDVCVLIERCMLHGKVCIEEGPLVELRCNTELMLHGERLAPDFVGSMHGGHLRQQRALEPVQKPRRMRRSQSKSPKSSKKGVGGVVSEKPAPRRLRAMVADSASLWSPG